MEEIIKGYINYVSRDYIIQGCLVCGSYAAGTYGKDSDLDILFLVPTRAFEMKLEIFEQILFDRIVVDSTILMEIISSNSVIGNILSYSFGTSRQILIPDPELSRIIRKCRLNIKQNEITYKKPGDKPKKICDGKLFTIRKEDNEFYLYKENIKII